MSTPFAGMKAYFARLEAEAPKSWSEYFERRLNEGRVALKPLGRPCHDCAVQCGFYLEISEALAKEPAEVREAYSAGWFCHNHPNRACRGNIDYLADTPSSSIEKLG